MTIETVTGVLRHVLTFGGGFLVAKGWIDNELLNNGVAALVTLVGVVWSVIAKRNAA